LTTFSKYCMLMSSSMSTNWFSSFSFVYNFSISLSYIIIVFIIYLTFWTFLSFILLLTNLCIFIAAVYSTLSTTSFCSKILICFLHFPSDSCCCISALICVSFWILRSNFYRSLRRSESASRNLSFSKGSICLWVMI
jgi:hypothetical protein